MASFAMSGFLLEAYCSDPSTLPAGITLAEKAVYYQGGYKIWYDFIAIGLANALAFKIFTYYTKKSDAAKAVTE